MYEGDEQHRASVYRSSEIKDRNIDEMMGLCRGLLADGCVNQKEAEFLLDWIKKHFVGKDLNSYPLNTLYPRLNTALADGALDEDESKEIEELLSGFTGGESVAEQVKDMSATLPLCDPAPDVIFVGKTFCLTGAFTIGTRTACGNMIKDLGGKISKTITKKTDYLIIGIIGSSAWIHSSYGRKIEKAVDLKEVTGIKLISEEHFIAFL